MILGGAIGWVFLRHGGGVLVSEGTSDTSSQWVLQDHKHKRSVLLIIIIIIIILCYSVHLFNGKNSLP